MFFNNFAGKTLAVTGATGGIGKAVAKAFYDLGCNLVLISRTDPRSEGDPSPQFLSSRALHISADVRDDDGFRKGLENANDRWGGIDFLVTTAGIYVEVPLAQMTKEQWRETLSINLDGVFNTCKLAEPFLKDGGAVVNLSSIAAHRGSKDHSHYAATKGAILSFSRSLALEWAARGIRVNCVSPGLIDTRFAKPILDHSGPALIEATPLKRLGQPDEVAKVVVFLCSDMASFVTGETVHVNGGIYMAG